MQIAIINPRYPFGKNHVFMYGSAFSITARLLAMGHLVRIIDLNLDQLEDFVVTEWLRSCDIIGISLTGASYIPGTITLISDLHRVAPKSKIILGGQVVEHLTSEQFQRVFSGNVVQIKDDTDLAQVLGCDLCTIPSPEYVSYIPAWESIRTDQLAMYLRHEGTLVVSQGCKYSCKFCAASHKCQKEQFRGLKEFEHDLQYLCQVAKMAGIEQLDFYASSLDFFQNPQQVVKYLEALTKIQEEYRIRIQVRCLCGMASFLEASKTIPDFGSLLERAGLWCIGFGVDGTDESVWRAQRKRNTMSDVGRCLKLCDKLDIHTEILMVFGFTEDTGRTLLRTARTSIALATKWPRVVLRPYLAKEVVPGNDGWLTRIATVNQIVDNPHQFYNLDYCTIASSTTHPRFWHRFMCNTAFLTICAVLAPFGKCVTSPLLPQGENGIYGLLAKLTNRLMPFDR